MSQASTLLHRAHYSTPMATYEDVLAAMPDAELANLYVANDNPQEGEPPAGLVKEYKVVRPPNDLNNVYAVVSKQYQLIRHREVCEQIFETLDKIPGIDLKPSLRLSNNGGQMKLTFGFGERLAINEKDWLQPSLHVLNSYDLSMNFSIMVGAMRLVCLNGLMAWSKHAGAAQKHIGRVRNLVEPAYIRQLVDNFAGEVLPVWRQAATIELTKDRSENIFRYAHEGVKMPVNVIEAAEKIWNHRAGMDEVERPGTAWVLYNTLTNVATHHRGLQLRKAMSVAKEKGLQEGSFKLLKDIVGGKV